MLEILIVLKNLIVWDYCLGVIFCGYLWKYRFKITHPDVKWGVLFLGVLAGVIWFLIKDEYDLARYIISYLFVTSFYELILIYVFNWLETFNKK